MAELVGASRDKQVSAVAEEARPPHGGRLMADALRRQGIDTIFTLGGGHIVELLDGCIDAGIRVVDMRHEGAASMAAEGWALVTGSTGVAAVTAGPGFTNALTGFVDACVGNVPMVLVAGRTALRQAGRGAVADVDQRAIAMPVAKWAATCNRGEMIGRLTEEAVHRARSERPGAVYLEVPHDVLGMRGAVVDGDATAVFPRELSRGSAASGDVARAVAAIEDAARPVVLAGSGAFWSGAGGQIARLCEVAHVPVITTSAARGLVPDSHRWCLGSLVNAGVALVCADVVVVLGSAFNANLLYGGAPLFGPDQVVIQVDVDGGQLGGNRLPDIALRGDVAGVVTSIVEARPTAPDTRVAWLDEARSLVQFSRDSWATQVSAHHGSRIHPGALAREVAAFARDVGRSGVTLVADGGDSMTWALGYFEAEGPGRLLTTTTAFGTLGVGLPFALAAQLARPGEPVILLSGDGAFGLSAMELDTAVRHHLPVVVVVANNAGWGDVRHHQSMAFGREVGSDLRDTRYDLLAAALGGHGEHVRDIVELRPALDRALESRVAAVVNVETDPAVVSELLVTMMQLGVM